MLEGQSRIYSTNNLKVRLKQKPAISFQRLNWLLVIMSPEWFKYKAEDYHFKDCSKKVKYD